MAGWGLGSFGIQRVRKRRSSDARDDATVVASDSDRDTDAVAKASLPKETMDVTAHAIILDGDSASHERGDLSKDTVPATKTGETASAAARP